MANIKKIKRKIVKIGKRMYKNDFVAASSGNISYRISPNKFLITPTGLSKGHMKEEQILLIDLKGNVIEGDGKPSSETTTHLTIYKNRRDVNCVCHAHPAFATAFACSDVSINSPLLSNVIIDLGKIAEVDYAPPGSKQLRQKISTFLKNYDTFLLSNHGVLTVGESIQDAYMKLETIENFAKIQYYAINLGSLKIMDKEQIDSLIALRNKFNIRNDLNKFK